MNVVLVALAAIMAGSGELHVLRRLRMFHGQVGDNGDYGSHVATHMALGLLFLGGGRYTLNTSPVATAVLLCALFPIFPNSPTDNRAHIQAARHLWVLAVEPRCLIARDVETGEPVFLPIRLRVIEHDATGSPAAARTTTTTASNGSVRSQLLLSPTLIPEIPFIKMVRVDSPRYWPVSLNVATNEAHRATFLRTRTLFVKRRAGHLTYLDDPRGTRSVFTRSKAEAGSAVFDFGHTAAMLAPPPPSSSSSTSGDGGKGGGARGRFQYFLSAFSPGAEAKGAIDYLVDSEEGRSDVTDDDSGKFEAFCASVVMECLTQDKDDVMTLYHTLYLSRVSKGVPQETYTTLLALRNYLLVLTFYEHDKLLSKGRQALVHRSLLDTMMMDAREEVEHGVGGGGDSKKLLVDYFASVGVPGRWGFDDDGASGVDEDEKGDEYSGSRRQPPASSRLAYALRLTEAPSLGTLLVLRERVRQLLAASDTNAAAVIASSATPEEARGVTRLVLAKTLAGLGIRDREAGVLADAMALAWV
jgi:hypothetical protein